MRFWEGGINIPLFGKPNIEKMKLKHDIKGLCKALGHKDNEVQEQAVNALAEMGEVAVEPMIAALVDQNLYRSAMQVLEKIGGVVVEPLINTLTNEETDVRVRERVGSVLGKIKATQAVETLIATLEDTSKTMWVRRVAVSTLVAIGDKRAIEPLIAAFSERYLAAYVVEAWVKGNFCDARAVEPLVAALDDRYPARKPPIIEALGKIIEALGKTGDKRAVEPILYAIKNGQLGRHQLCIAAEALGKIGDERAVETLREILQREKPMEPPPRTITDFGVFKLRRGEKVDYEAE